MQFLLQEMCISKQTKSQLLPKSANIGANHYCSWDLRRSLIFDYFSSCDFTCFLAKKEGWKMVDTWKELQRSEGEKQNSLNPSLSTLHPFSLSFLPNSFFLCLHFSLFFLHSRLFFSWTSVLQPPLWRISIIEFAVAVANSRSSS